MSPNGDPANRTSMGNPNCVVLAISMVRAEVTDTVVKKHPKKSGGNDQR